jgi:hypothetical protein
MGSLKEEWMDAQEELRDKKLGKILGISYNELMQLEHEPEEDTDNDGNIIALVVYFGEKSQKHILAKVKPLLNGAKSVTLDPNIFY